MAAKGCHVCLRYPCLPSTGIAAQTRDLSQSLTLAFVENGTLQICADRTAAISAFEEADVGSGIVNFYELYGEYLDPSFTTPDREYKLFNMVGWVQSGLFDLVPSINTAHDPFALALYEAAHLEPNEFFSNFGQLKQALRKIGVQLGFNECLGTGEA